MNAKKPDPAKLFRAPEPEEQGIETLYAKKMEDEHEEYQFIQKEFEPPNLYTSIPKNRVSSKCVEAVSKPKN